MEVMTSPGKQSLGGRLRKVTLLTKSSEIFACGVRHFLTKLNENEFKPGKILMVRSRHGFSGRLF